MYGLYGWLLARGEEVYMNSRPNGDCIAIYPEIVNGNPANASTVVRYLLNKPGFMGSNGVSGPTIFGKNEKIVAFSRVFYDSPDLYMFLPVINLKVFRDQHKKRTKKAVFYGKWKGNQHPDGCIELSRANCQDQQALADLLNECEVIYVYDQVTAIYDIARLCGCRVVVFPADITKDEFKEYEPGMNGINWDGDEGNQVDSEQFEAHYRVIGKVFEERLDNFIDFTQS